MKALLAKILIAPIFLLGSFFHSNTTKNVVEKPVELGASATLPINGSTYNLSGSGVTSSATSFTLSSLTLPQNGYKIVDADASALFYMTLEPGSRTRQEVVSCTTIVQNVAGTATISGCTRGLSPISPYTASTTLKFAHPGGSQVIFGDAAQLFNEYAALGNDQTITAVWTFDDNDTYRPRIDADTDTAVSTAFVTLGQLSRQAISGASNGSQTTKGIFEGATAIEQASSTSAGSTAALLVNLALFSTSSPKVGCNGTSVAGALCNVIAQNDGTINPLFIATSSSYNYTWGGSTVFTGAIYASSSQNIIASTTIFSLNLGLMNATNTASTAATSSITNLKINNNATTTTLTISNSCSGCFRQTATATNTGAGPTTIGGSASVAATCSGAQIAIGGGGSNTASASLSIVQSYPSASNAWTVTYVSTGNIGANTMTAYAVCVNP